MTARGAVVGPLEVVPGAPEVILGDIGGALTAHHLGGILHGLDGGLVQVGGGGQIGTGEVLEAQYVGDDLAG